MADVAVCPNCNGEKRKYNARSGQMEPCPTCDAEGVVWRGGKAEEAGTDGPGDDALDLTYRG